MAITIIYDGDCIFCHSFVHYSKLKDSAGPVTLISARSADDPVVRDVMARGFNLNAGFVVIHDGEILHGAEAMTRVARLTDDNYARNKAVQALFSSPLAGRLLYPFLAGGRALTLMLRGRAFIPMRTAPLGRAVEVESGYVRAIRFWPILLILAAGLGHYGLLMSPRLIVREHDYFFVAGLMGVVCASIFLLVGEAGNVFYGALKNLRVIYWLAYLASILLVTNLFETIFVRRLFFGLMLVPVLVLAWQLFRENWRRPDAGFLPAFAPFWLLLIIAVPGFYLPPFYDGIAGWTLRYDVAANSTMGGYQLVKQDGSVAWYSSAFDDPVTQDSRLQNAIILSQADNRNIYRYLIRNYRRIYPVLQAGFMPNQRLLGSFAYPTHTLTRYDSIYKSFAPDEIVRIQRVSYTLDPKGKVIGKNVIQLYDVRTDRIIDSAAVGAAAR